jgi:hypothetical protein
MYGLVRYMLVHVEVWLLTGYDCWPQYTIMRYLAELANVQVREPVRFVHKYSQLALTAQLWLGRF